jgi:TctA family transporter
MDVLANLALGFQTAMSLSNLLYCLVGVFLGTAVGVLPGIGPIATIAMLLPITFGLPPVSALIMLSGIYYGAQYGGSTTAILINLPGESASLVTALDGHRMARQGKAGLALATAAIGSFIAGTAATLLVALFAPPLAEVALQFGPAEYFSLMVLGLVASIVLASGSLLHALAVVVVGLVLGLLAPTSIQVCHATASGSRSLPTALASSSSPWACSGWPRSSRISSTRPRAPPPSRA